MKKKTRRKFLVELGITSGIVAMGHSITKAFSLGEKDGKKSLLQKTKNVKEDYTVDFRYSPGSWQSTYCFPDDPYKSLVGKNGELLYGHPGLEAELDVFAHIVFVSLGKEASRGKKLVRGEYIEQKLEAPGIPIITTRLQFSDAELKLTSFASNRNEEGRVDNLLIEVTPKNQTNAHIPVSIEITTKSKCSSSNKEEATLVRQQIGSMSLEGDKPALFMAIDSPVKLEKMETGWACMLQSEDGGTTQQVKFFARFPQEGQALEKISNGMHEPEKILVETKAFWKAWKPTQGKVRLQVHEPYQSFLTQATCNMLQAREMKKGKRVFQVGPTVYRGFWFIDATFMLEAARYLGYDKEAHEGLEAMWDLQNNDGSFFAGAGNAHWKDTAAALYSLARQADLSQNWDYFQELWPDASKAVEYLKSLRDKAQGTPSGQYGILAPGFGDSGLGGIHSEITNTLWAIIGLKALTSVADRIKTVRREIAGTFLNELILAFNSYVVNTQMRDHPKGFKYLPMVLKEDPMWNDPDERKRPRPQAAQVYLSHAIHPGLFIGDESEVLKGHVELMKSVTKEDIPAETGWLSHDAVWTYNAPIAAEVYLWAKMPALARKTFAGFLNHASPLYAWREEQSLKGITPSRYIGDMPHNWASAECIRFLRHIMILEDDVRLRLFEGLAEEDMLSQKPINIEYSPTKWGRITLLFEPVDSKTWVATYKREDYDKRYVSNLTYVEFNRRLPAKFELDKVEGASIGQEEIGRVLVDPNVDSWKATFRIFS